MCEGACVCVGGGGVRAHGCVCVCVHACVCVKYIRGGRTSYIWTRWPNKLHMDNQLTHT